MNKQLLRLKQRSNNDLLQVAESDDSNNLYVNVDDGKLDVGTVDEITNIVNVEDVDSVNLVDTVTTVSSVTDVVNVQDVDSVNLVDAVTSITNPVASYQYNKIDTIIYSSGHQTMIAGMTEVETHELTVPYNASFLNKQGSITITNLSPFYDINIQMRQVITAGGTPLRVATNQYMIPPVSNIRPTTEAYSSCVIYNKTGPTWTDHSTHFNVETGYDVTFPITEVDDAIYFGSKGKFNTLSIYVETAGVYDGTLVWEFWNGSSWVSPTIYIDNTNELQIDHGQFHVVAFDGLTSWTVNQPDGASMVNQYWMRLRCSAFNSITTNPVIRTVLIKPIYNSALSNFELREIFPTAGYTTQIVLNPTCNIDSTHEVVYNINIGAR